MELFETFDRDGTIYGFVNERDVCYFYIKKISDNQYVVRANFNKHFGYEDSDSDYIEFSPMFETYEGAILCLKHMKVLFYI